MAPQEVSADSYDMNKVSMEPVTVPASQGCCKSFSDKIINFLENAFGRYEYNNATL